MIKDDVVIVAGNVLSISSDVVDPWREDVISSLLFSRRYANSQADRFAEAQQWCKYYDGALGRLKWELRAGKSNDFEPVDGSVIVVKDLIREKLVDILNSTRVEQFERLMRSIELTSNADMLAAQVEEHAAVKAAVDGVHDVSCVALQLSLVGQGPVVCSVFVRFDTTQEVDFEFFNQDFTSEHIVGKVSVDVSQRVLNKVMYEKSRMREMIASILAEAGGIADA
ncbi:hypothetical protein [Pseudomonas fluorescens]|uniref:Uncharacterized protein n=1 Tax=Pseudomonas fluorescens TaxID=294 RepID=A0A5E7AZ31_PSEFL|nr:hypothetical protein [Pseudomonas fluorescens]VVN81884.1 hypothetical protein PS710_01188 [Pseudomonas fluorescens]